MIEYEKKLLLTKEEYDEILRMKTDTISSKFQINYYFDTNDYKMNSIGTTYRIRLKNGKFEATIKQHNENNSFLSVENTLYVKNEFDMSLFESLGLHLQGSLLTERTIIFKNEFCEMMLDYNIYLNTHDFELEIEFNADYEDYAMQHLEKVASILLKSNLISSKEELFCRINKGKNKSGRFFEQKQKI